MVVKYLEENSLTSVKEIQLNFLSKPGRALKNCSNGTSQKVSLHYGANLRLIQNLIILRPQKDSFDLEFTR